MTGTEYDAKYMANFSPTLVHRIMLTPPSSFSSLTMNGQPRSSSLTFVQVLRKEGYNVNNKESSNDDGNRSIDQGSIGNEVHGASQHSMEETIAQTVRKAFRDAVLCQISQTKQGIDETPIGSDSSPPCLYAPLLEIIQEIHQKLKLLVPNRKDLHQLLNYGQELKSRLETFQGVLTLLLDIAEKLSLLESEDRSASTQQWLDLAKGLQNRDGLEDEADGALTLTLPNPDNDDDDDDDDEFANGESSLEHRKITILCKEFILASATFLHDKIDQTQTDIADFQLGNILAPKIHALGKEYLRRDFETRFDASVEHMALSTDRDTGEGANGKENLVPHTRTWLKEIVQNCDIEKEELLHSDQRRREILLQIGWVDSILFRSPRNASSVEQGDTIGELNSPFYMPEIFYLDIMSVKAIRMTTKISVVGSALAFIASSIGGSGDAASMLRQDPLDSIVQDCRQKLIRAMGNKTVGSQELFERGVGDAVMELTIVLNPSLEIDSVKEGSIRSRTVATMRGDDPVIQLLDNRMRNIFREMMVLNPSSRQQVPDSIRTGRIMSSAGGNSVQGVYGDAFLRASKEEFVKKGFSFYADELAESTLAGHRIMNLASYIHGSWVDKMVKNACKKTE